MRFNRKLLERFNGNTRKIIEHCRHKGLSEVELNWHYEAADRVMFKENGVVYRRPANPRGVTLRKAREGGRS